MAYIQQQKKKKTKNDETKCILGQTHKLHKKDKINVQKKKTRMI